MVYVMPVEKAARKWLRRSILAYLGGQQDLRWILGVVRGSREEAAALLLTEFRNYSGSSRYQELQASLRDTELLKH
jgi:hypothetical protein